VESKVDIKASHKIIRRLMKVEGGNINCPTKTLEKIAYFFEIIGGDWELLFLGNIDQVILLKKLVKTFKSLGLDNEPKKDARKHKRS
jgi:hypothetical protein